jgi:prevent-host-death family protein
MTVMADSSRAPAELEAVSATEAKNGFGSVLDRVLTKGRVAITKHDEVRAVVLSVSEYEALLAQQQDPLAELSEEFDALVQRMQTPDARRAGHALFGAAPKRLGQAAVAGARKRG